MKHVILEKGNKYLKKGYDGEENLTSIFFKNHKDIISKKSLWIGIEKKFKSKNFQDSICDGFLLVWENPTTPLLYLTEIELEKHSIDKHILPQLGNFISFIQRATRDELNEVRGYIYDEVKKNKAIFKQIQNDSEHEVHELIDNALEDLQILLVIDRVKPELSIGLSQIEKAINIKIRKIEISKFINSENEEIISYVDSEEFEDEGDVEESDEEIDEYTIEYHISDKPNNIIDIFKEIYELFKNKVKVVPTKHYIGFFKESGMIFSCVIRKKNIIFYSKALPNEFSSGFSNISLRDVGKVGHYTNHLPTEIALHRRVQLEELKKYLELVYEKY